jgi:hypothetical protein
VTTESSASDADAVTDRAEDAPPIAPVRIVSGDPTDDELAATHAVIAAILAEQEALGAQRAVPRVDQWRAQARAGRAPLTPGPGAWNGTRGLRGR